MPAKRTPKKAATAAEKPVVEAPAAEEPAEEPAEEADATAEAVEVEPVPMNRAERRAKGKVRQQPGFGPNKVVGSRGPASAQRNFANRRSG